MNRARTLSAVAATAVVLAVSLLAIAVAEEKPATDRPIRALLITGGCCHDYPFQTKAMQEAAKERGVDIEWTVVNEGGTGREAQIALYDNPDWAKGYDVVVHNECFGYTKDPEYIRRITAAHKAGANAVVIHCALHTYRMASIDDWREFLGVTSRRHDHQSKYPLKVVAADHPILQGFPAHWTTPMDELYIIEKVWPNTKVLATAVSEKTGDLQPVMWTNEYGKARIFGVSFGHSRETFSEGPFLDALIRGLQWSAGRLPS